jgi:hypothetical protein
MSAFGDEPPIILINEALSGFQGGGQKSGQQSVGKLGLSDFIPAGDV